MLLKKEIGTAKTLFVQFSRHIALRGMAIPGVSLVFMSPSLLLLPIQQELFEFQAPSKPAETLGSHNPMSWEYEGQGILVHGLPHGPGGAGLSD